MTRRKGRWWKQEKQTNGFTWTESLVGFATSAASSSLRSNKKNWTLMAFFLNSLHTKYTEGYWPRGANNRTTPAYNHDIIFFVITRARFTYTVSHCHLQAGYTQILNTKKSVFNYIQRFIAPIELCLHLHSPIGL